MSRNKPSLKIEERSPKRERLAVIAADLAQIPFHGEEPGLGSNLQPLIERFPGGCLQEFDRKWCAAFVYHCCILAGFDIPPRYPPPVSCSFAGVAAWIEWAKLPGNRFYFSRRSGFHPARGDLVIFNNVFIQEPHDHMGIVLEVRQDHILVAEGNVYNLSALLPRERDCHIRGYVRIPDDYRNIHQP